MRLGKKLAEGFAADPEADRVQHARGREAEPEAVTMRRHAEETGKTEETTVPAERPAGV